MNWLWWILLGLTVTSVVAELNCDVKLDQVEEIKIKPCADLTNELKICWDKPTNIVCKGARAKRGCVNNIYHKLDQCKVNGSAEYLRRTVITIQATDEILCRIASSPDFNQQCWQNARRNTQRQAQFMMDGYDTEDGCGYRTIFSLLTDANSFTNALCEKEMSQFRRLWYDLWPCNKYNETYELWYENKRGDSISQSCLQIQAQVDDCFGKHSYCTSKEHEWKECFDKALNASSECNDLLLRKNTEHRAETMMTAIKYICDSPCHKVLHLWCWRYVNELTLYTSGAVSDFHTPQSCENRKLHMDNIVALSGSKCHDLIKDFSDYIYSQANCREKSEQTPHQPFQPHTHDTQHHETNDSQKITTPFVYNFLIAILLLINSYK